MKVKKCFFMRCNYEYNSLAQHSMLIINRQHLSNAIITRSWILHFGSATLRAEPECAKNLPIPFIAFYIRDDKHLRVFRMPMSNLRFFK